MVNLYSRGAFTRRGKYHGVPYKLRVCAMPGSNTYTLDEIKIAHFPPHKIGSDAPYTSIKQALDAADRYARMIIDLQH